MHIGVRIKLGWSSKLTKLEVDFFYYYRAEF